MTEETTRFCTTCKVKHEITDFPKDGTNGRRINRRCKASEAARHRKARADAKAKRLAQSYSNKPEEKASLCIPECFPLWFPIAKIQAKEKGWLD